MTIFSGKEGCAPEHRIVYCCSCIIMLIISRETSTEIFYLVSIINCCVHAFVLT
uniref:Uncharacterized protein n=1 Tax=Arundo donax TaxID=35708 RepID=A0A0A9CBY6_ARUDO